MNFPFKNILGLLNRLGSGPSSGRFLWLLNSGHGQHQAGKRSPWFQNADGEMIRIEEWAINYDIIQRLKKLLDDSSYHYEEINTNPYNKGQWTARVDKANEAARRSTLPCIYLSQHCDAWSPKKGRTDLWQNKAHGVYALHYGPETQKLAQIFAKHIAIVTGRRLMYEKTEGASENKRLYELRETEMPALILETLFFNYKVEAKLLATEEMRQKIAYGYFLGIQEVEGAKDQHLKLWKSNSASEPI